MDYHFRSAVTLLERWLKQYESREARGKTTPSSRRAAVGPVSPGDRKDRSRASGLVAPRLSGTAPTRPAEVPIRPAPSRLAAPKFSGIRQTRFHQEENHTAMIWQRLRPQFGPAHFRCNMPPASRKCRPRLKTGVRRQDKKSKRPRYPACPSAGLVGTARTSISLDAASCPRSRACACRVNLAMPATTIRASTTTLKYEISIVPHTKDQ
jgi:hypothetical protein